MADGEERVTCPFNKAHVIITSRMGTHLTNCAKNYPNSPLKLCPFNSIHFVHHSKLEGHIKTCPDRASAERLIFAKPLPQVASSSTALNTDEENWDDVDVPSYLEKRGELLATKPVIIMGETNVGKAQRRAFMKQEALRMAELKDKKS